MLKRAEKFVSSNVENHRPHDAGDEISSQMIISYLQGRVCVVGGVSQYNAVATSKVQDRTIDFIVKEIKMQGMMVRSYKTIVYEHDA